MRLNRPTPKLPRHVEKSIRRGHWTPELSLIVDRAIVQADQYFKLEFNLDAHGAQPP